MDRRREGEEGRKDERLDEERLRVEVMRWEKEREGGLMGERRGEETNGTVGVEKTERKR